MAVNPLVVFVGLSITTLGGLVAVVQQKKSSVEPAPAVVQSQPQTGSQNQPKIRPLLVPETKAPTAKASEPKKLAGLEPGKKIDTKSRPTPETTKEITKEITTKPVKPKAETTPIPVAPSFDMVRVEKDGGAVVVGKAAPGADVLLKLNGKTIGQTKANEKGDWVFVPDQLIPQGSNEMIVEATGQDKKVVRSKQSIFIAIPKGANEKPLIVVTKPDAPTRVLQQPVAKAEPEKTSPAKPADISSVKTAKTDLSPPQPQTTPSAGKENLGAPIASQVAEQQVASQPVANQPVSSQPTEKLASLPEPAEKPQAVTPPAKVPEVSRQARLTFGTVDYNDRGEIVFTGKAAAGSTVRLYVDNEFVGDAVAGADGNWVFRGKEQIRPGEHELRADQLNTEGKVAQRTAVPFVRANPEKVAALLKTRKKTPQPSKAPVAAKTPEASVVSKAPAAQPAEPVADKPKEPATPAETVEVAKVAPVAKTPDPQKVQKPVTVAPAASAPADPVSPVAKQPEKAAPAAEQAQEQVAASSPAKTPPAKTPVASEPAPAKSEPELVAHVVIQPGNNLWNISRVIYGKGIAYTTIYQANQKQIKNPHKIYPGQIFTTPGTTSTGSIAPDQREPLASAGTGAGAGKTIEN